jgi:hypothetical protein
MNVEIRTEAPIFLFWEYLFRIFGIMSLQCDIWEGRGGGGVRVVNCFISYVWNNRGPYFSQDQ